MATLATLPPNDGPEFDVFISYADADRAWAEGYLLDALGQAGVRCHTEAAFALGVPRLMEFERAIKASQRTLLILSPAYMADDYSRFVDLLSQTYGLETSTWPVLPVILEPVKLPTRLALLTALDATDPADHAGVIERLCAELRRPAPGPAPRPPCPYPGMVPFREADSERFFGREREVEELLQSLRLHPFLTVIGPSGSGKSSLVFAGLIPALRRSCLFGAGGWSIRSLRPGERPMISLTEALGGDPGDRIRGRRPSPAIGRRPVRGAVHRRPRGGGAVPGGPAAVRWDVRSPRRVDLPGRLLPRPDGLAALAGNSDAPCRGGPLGRGRTPPGHRQTG